MLNVLGATLAAFRGHLQPRVKRHAWPAWSRALNSATCFIDLRPWPGQASVEVPGLSLSFRLPTLVWLSFGLRSPGRRQGGERLKRGLLCSK
ncbi:hypothetical protein GCM10027259_60620 [Micromonospora palomenae]